MGDDMLLFPDKLSGNVYKILRNCFCNVSFSDCILPYFPEYLLEHKMYRA
jgi:hypothetical protein